MFHLRYGVIHVADGHDPHADQPLRRDGAVVLRQPLVVGADDGFVHLIMADITPEHRPGHHGREQHLGIEAIQILLSDALFG